MSKIFYRCENEFGPDPCEFAKANRKIPESAVSLSLSGVNPKCPGKTLSGNPCNSELIGPYKGKGGLWERLRELFTGKLRIPVIAGAVIVLIVCIWVLVRGCQGEPKFSAGPNPLVFPQTEGGTVTSDLRIHNDGDGDLIIDKVMVQPAAFSLGQGKISVAPKGTEKLTIRFTSPSTEMMEGELVLHSNDRKSPTSTIKLIANRDPWWVFRKLETTSKILHKEP